jgi:hypothetical protein
MKSALRSGMAGIRIVSANIIVVAMQLSTITTFHAHFDIFTGSVA